MKKIVILLFSLAVAFTASAQQYLMDMENALGSNLVRDTVTNTGTGTLTTDRKALGPGTVSVVVFITEISGTTGGTLTLQGSLDGTNFVTINQPNIQTAIVTITAADVATQRVSWSLSSNPFLYYRVSWTGTGTMSAWMEAKFMKH